MRFRWEQNSYGRSGLVAVPERGDVRPVFEELWLDYMVDALSADRLAVAAALTFYAQAGARFKVPEAISPATARAIEALDPTGRRRVDLVLASQLVPKRGTAQLVVGVDDPGGSVANSRGGERRVALNILRTDRYSGGLLTMDSLSLASNAWLHVKHGVSALAAQLPYVAVAVLLAEDLGAGAIELSADALDSDDALAGQLVSLCNAVGLVFLRG